MGRASDPSSWSPRERAAVERQAVVGRKTTSTEALRREQAAQQAKSVPFKTGAAVAKPTPQKAQRETKEFFAGSVKITKPREKFIEAAARRRIVERKAPLRERVIGGARRVGVEAKQFIRGIPRGAKGVATMPFSRFVGTEEFADGRRMTLYEQQAVEFGKASIGGKVGEFFGGVTFAGVSTQPVFKGLTPTTRGVSVTKITPKGEFKAVGVIEAGEKVYPVAVKGRAARVPSTRITAAKGVAVVRTKPTISVGAKPAKALKFEGFKFKGLSKQVSKTPTQEFRLSLGKVTKVTKAVVKKGVSKVKRVRPDTRLFAGRQVTTKITPTKAISAAKIDIFKGLTKVGSAKELGIVKRVPKEFPRFLRFPKGVPTVTKPTITRPVAKQITKGVVETIAPSFAKLKTGLPLAPRIPRAKQITIPRIDPFQKVSTREITKVEPITKLAPIQRARQIERPVTLPREAQRVAPITIPMIKPIVATKVKAAQLQKVRPIEVVIPKTQQVARTSYPTMPFAPIAPPITKGFGFPPFAMQPPSLALPRGVPLEPLPIGREFSYQPSLEALARREFGEAPKEAISVRFRPLTKKWVKKQRLLFGGF